MKKENALLISFLLLLFSDFILESTVAMSSNEIEIQQASERKQGMLTYGGAIADYELELGGSHNLGVVTNSIIINGTHIYVIANGTYTLNDIIIVEDAATLIIKNATVIFNTTDYTVITSYDNARVYIEDSVLEHSRWFYLHFHDSSIVSVLRSEIKEIITTGSANVTVGNSTVSTVNNWDSTHFSADNSAISSLASYESSHITISASSIGGMAIEDSSETLISNSTIGSIDLGFTLDSDVSLVSLPTGFVGRWGLYKNNTVNKAYVNLTLFDVQVDSWWIIAHDFSAVSITGIRIGDVSAQESSSVSIINSTIDYVWSVMDSTVYLSDSKISSLEMDLAGYETVFLINSTYSVLSWIIDMVIGNPRLYVGWYLDVLVIDGRRCPLPNAHLKVYWENGALLTGTTTDDEGLARFILYEKMINSTGTFPYGNYLVKATYDNYTCENAIKSITENMKITAIPWICIYHRGLLYGIYTDWLVIIQPRGRPIRIPIA